MTTPSHLQNAEAELKRIRDERDQLYVQLAKVSEVWTPPGSPGRAERHRIKAALHQNAIDRRHLEHALNAMRRSAKSSGLVAKSGRHWSDQTLACLTYLLEQEGRRDLIKRAHVLVANGWPHEHTKRATPPAPAKFSE